MIQPIFIGNVAGLSYAKPDLTMLDVNARLHLVPEPTNEFDPRAIKVVHPAAGKLGYIPKESTEAVHTAWTNEFFVRCFIKEVIPGPRFDKVIIVCDIECQPLSSLS